MFRSWMVKVAAPFWAALYLVIFKGFGAIIFVSLSVVWGVWLSALTLILLYGVWGTVFYLFLLQTNSFEHFRNTAGQFLEKKQGKFFKWLHDKIVDHGKGADISPLFIIFVFVVESPLTGVPLIRFAYPKEKFLFGIFWIWVGAVAEVVTWFLPIYGGGFSLVKALFVLVSAG